MHKKKFICIICVLFICVYCLNSQYSIKGQLVDSQKKYSKVNLEFVPTIEGLNGSSPKNIINSTLIEEDGQFIIAGNYLPRQDGLYRLSLLKSGNGSGITNGEIRDYILIVLNNNSKIDVLSCGDVATSFSNCILKGNIESRIIQDFYDNVRQPFYSDYRHLHKNKSEINKETIFNKHRDILMNYCDTSTHLLPSLIAFAHIREVDVEMKKNPEFFKSFIDKILKEKPGSPYVQELRTEMARKEETLFGKKKSYTNLLLGLLIGIVLLQFLYILNLRKKMPHRKRENETPLDTSLEKIKGLSKKETEVFEHIVNGLSNKEIASVLFIEVATVKSHVSKIYSKLDINSRKQAIAMGAKRV